MKAGNIIAHRGWWTSPAEKNTREAFDHAVTAGYGIETDVRDLDGELVISHDPARRGAMLFGEFLRSYGPAFVAARLALNVKAGGLQTMLAEAAANTPLDAQIFVFDMSVPDALGYRGSRFELHTRVSEYEREPSFIDDAAGVWVDAFSGTFDQIGAASLWVERGLKVTVVSPELHRRPHGEFWDRVAEAGLHHSPLFSICTDFPDQALERFGDAA